MDFDFDLGADTAMSVASEMVEDLSLSAEDARAVAAAIRDEIKMLTGLLHRRGNDSLASSSNGVRTCLTARHALQAAPSNQNIVPAWDRHMLTLIRMTSACLGSYSLWSLQRHSEHTPYPTAGSTGRVHQLCRQGPASKRRAC